MSHHRARRTRRSQGGSPGSLVVLAVALACPIAMYFGMRGMSMSQDSPHAPSRSLRRDSEVRDAPTAHVGQQPRPSQEEHTPR